jgi:hypothetical protein
MNTELGGQSIGTSRTASGKLAVERGINSDRMAMLAVICAVGVALTDDVLGGIVVVALLVLIYRVKPAKQATMSAMHWITRA